MNFNSIVNVPLRNQAIRKAYVPLIGMSGVSQVSVVDQARQLVGNHTHFRAIREYRQMSK